MSIFFDYIYQKVYVNLSNYVHAIYIMLEEAELNNWP